MASWTGSLGLIVVVAMPVLAGCGGDDERQPAAVQRLVATPTAAPTQEQTAVDPASAARVDMVRRALAQGIKVDRTDEHGRTALMMAAFEGHSEVVGVLLDHGAVVDRRDGAGRTALMYAASGPFPETVALLLERGASVHVADSTESWTALMFAAGEGHVAVVETLLRHGADPGRRDDDDETAVDHARLRGHREVVRLLESAGG